MSASVPPRLGAPASTALLEPTANAAPGLATPTPDTVAEAPTALVAGQVDTVERRRDLLAKRSALPQLERREREEIGTRYQARLDKLEEKRNTARGGLLIGAALSALLGGGALGTGIGGVLAVEAAATGGIGLGVAVACFVLFLLFAPNGWLPLPGVDDQRKALLAERDAKLTELAATHAQRRAAIERDEEALTALIKTAKRPLPELPASPSGVATAKR